MRIQEKMQENRRSFLPVCEVKNMIRDDDMQVITETIGAEAPLGNMDEHSLIEMGRKTYDFVRRVLRNPEYRRMVEERVAQKTAALDAAT